MFTTLVCVGYIVKQLWTTNNKYNKFIQKISSHNIITDFLDLYSRSYGYNILIKNNIVCIRSTQSTTHTESNYYNLEVYEIQVPT